MNALLKLRPGLFGLLAAAIALSTMATAITKTPRTATRSTGPTQAAALPTEQAAATAEQGEQPEQAYTYLQFQIDTDLANLEQTVKDRAVAHIDQGRTAAELNDRLYELSQVWRATPEQIVQRLAINRALQSLVDGEPAPTTGPIVNPTVEDYRNVSSTAE